MTELAERVAGLLGAIDRHPLLGGTSWLPLDLEVGDTSPVIGSIVAPYPALWRRRSQIVIALEEARGNVARHAGDPAGGICFVHHETPDRRSLEFLFADAGRGLEIDGELPPYPWHMVGREYEFRQTVDGVVWCRIADSDVVEIGFRAHHPAWPARRFDDIPCGGMGLSIMSKVMDRVAYLTHIGPSNFLWMQIDVPEGARE